MFEDFEPEVLNRTPRVHHAVPLGCDIADPRGTMYCIAIRIWKCILKNSYCVKKNVLIFVKAK